MAILVYKEGRKDFVNFELLEEITSKDFVIEVKAFIEVFNVTNDLIEIKINTEHSVTKVIMDTGYALLILKYYSNGVFESINLLKSELREIVGDFCD